MVKKTILTALIFSMPALIWASSDNILSQLKSDPSNENLISQVSVFALEKEDFLNKVLEEMASPDNPSSYRCSLAKAVSATQKDIAYVKTAQLLARSGGDLEICLSKAVGDTKNPYASAALESNVEEFIYGSDKGGEKDIKKKIAAINSIWSLGEIGSKEVMEKLEKYYNGSDEVLRINIVFSMGKLKNNKVLPYLRKIAQNASESMAVRSAAYEMIDELEGK
ncbi:MAG: HEAT repeat domain-containing protein [Elusimicrobia bacterium]|nr:HEAT repeat domain-containing protein [Elusimicrobiota bacterium]